MNCKLGFVFRQIRQSRGWTLALAADGIISLAFLSKFERGENDISAEKLFALLERMAIPASEYLYLVNSYSFDSITQFYDEINQCVMYHDCVRLVNMLTDHYIEHLNDNNQICEHKTASVRLAIAKTNQSPPQKDDITTIKKYLLNVDEWGCYELLLYETNLTFFNPELVLILSKNAYRKGKMLAVIRPQLLANILIKTITLFLENRAFNLIPYFLNAAKCDVNGSHLIYENIILNILNGLYLMSQKKQLSIGQAHVTEGVMMLEKLGFTNVASTYQQLSERFS